MGHWESIMLSRVPDRYIETEKAINYLCHIGGDLFSLSNEICFKEFRFHCS